ncbi:MAG: hypothetical protein HUK00_05890 [Bacteroidaceae bacterium]|nr:hypothetical protein [Bacteroidaceae bacterium]
MTKKVLFGVFAAVGLLATSCSENDLTGSMTTGDYVSASFVVESPASILTRAAGDGTTVDSVACAVFDADGNELTTLRDTVALSAKTATYTVSLFKGHDYRVVFFAYNGDADAYDFTDMKNIKVLGDQKTNLEGRDAFTAYADVTAAETMNSIVKAVSLYRPFAQLNMGTNDVDAAKEAGFEVDSVSVKVTNVYTAFNAYDDQVAGDPVAVTFALNDTLTETLTVKVNGVDKTYTYLALNYLLVGDKDAEKSLTDVELTIQPKTGADSKLTFNNVPVQRNYRTNIVGSLLTNSAQFDITLDTDFDGDYNSDEYLEWKGVRVKEPEQDASGNYLVSSMYELNWLAMQTCGGQPAATRAATSPNRFIGKTILLQNDIDCGGNIIQPIGDNTVAVYPGHSFGGTFDGQGHTIKNFKVKTSEPSYAAAGLFGTITGVVKNVKVDNAEISSTHYAGGIVGYISAETGATIEGCTVTNSTITSTPEDLGTEWDNGDKVGGIVGYVAGGDKVLNNTVGGKTTIKAYRDLGGIVGCTAGIVKGNKIDGDQVTVIVDNTFNYKNYTEFAKHNAGHIIGRNNGATADANEGTCTLVDPYAAAN